MTYSPNMSDSSPTLNKKAGPSKSETDTCKSSSPSRAVVHDANPYGPESKAADFATDAGNRKTIRLDGILAVDPGVKGGFAWCDWLTGPQVAKMPQTDADTIHALRDHFAEGRRHLAMELPARNIFGAGAAQLATLHRNVGFLIGASMAIGYSIELIPPQRWQKTLHLKKAPGTEKRVWKNRLKDEAQRRFPTIRVTLDTADALLILSAASN